VLLHLISVLILASMAGLSGAHSSACYKQGFVGRENMEVYGHRALGQDTRQLPSQLSS
jgi:hypothetical protein